MHSYHYVDYFTDVTTGKAKCVGGDIIDVSVGDEVHMSTHFAPEGAVLSIRVKNGTSTRESNLTVASPQLDRAYAWQPFIDHAWLRPYVSFESWDAPATNASK